MKKEYNQDYFMRRRVNVGNWFSKLKGQKIISFRVKQNGGDQYFELLTDKVAVKFGANDLGVWLIEWKNKKNA